ncbi:ABC transporter ATP-binding protein [Nocardiopsis rhodophaea]|uniref:ABC transporter ATP-binding protein n=1 Tax=Nocardiopsis rhodophaea TaxID=280238 RepID=UPI0031DB455B
MTDSAARHGDGPNTDGVPLSHLLRLARPQTKALVLATVLSMVTALVALAQPVLVKRVLDEIESGGSVAVPVTAIITIFLAEAILGGVNGYLRGRIGESIVAGLRSTMVARLLRWPLRAHEAHSPGDLISRVGSDTGQVRAALGGSLTEITAGTVTLVGALVAMALLDPLMLGMTLGCLVVAFIAVAVVSVRIMVATVQAQQAVGRLSAGLERVLRTVRTVKLSVAEAREEKDLTGAARSAYKAGLRQAKLEALVEPVTSISVQCALILVVGAGGFRVSQGTMDLGTLIAFLMYVFYLAVPATTLFMSVTDLQAGRAAMARIQQVLDEPDERAGGSREAGSHAEGELSTGEPGTEPPAAELREVEFGYPARPLPKALRGVSFSIPQRAKVAVVGPSGSGKSTVLTLLARLYEPDAGMVRLLGRLVEDYPLDDVRARIGFVEQEAPIMAGTLRSNLTYARPDATEEQIRGAIAKTNLAEFVDGLPKGLDTEVGDGGALLSGGQRQRVAIARMLLKEPSLLLLDEATSQMDGENERLLVETLDKAAQECAVVVIAHRLSTVRNADRIIVMEDGRVRTVGTHDSLVHTDALYARLAHSALHEDRRLDEHSTTH